MVDTRPRVSICIPAYEEADSLARTLQSVFEQSLSDFEVVIADDSRSGAVAAAVQPWLSDPRMKYVLNAERLGSPGNWNRTLELASGDLLKIMHHDDWFRGKDSLAQFVGLLDSRPEAAFAFSAATACDEGGRVLFEHAPTEHQLNLLRADPNCLLFANFIGAPSATIVRRDVGLHFDPRLKWLVDLYAYIRVLRGHPVFAYSSKPLVNITASGPRQATYRIQRDPSLQFFENAYVASKLPLRLGERWRSTGQLRELAHRLDDVQALRLLVKLDPIDARIEARAVLWARRAMLRVGQLKARALRFFRKKPAGEPVAKLSYSQCGEDMIVDFLLMWLGLENITYLDIGANHPFRLNNTFYFYRQGFRGVLVEPDPDACKALSLHRPRDHCLNIAIGTDGQSVAKMYVMTSRTLNTTVPSQANEYQAYGRERVEKVIEVPQRSINDVLSSETDSVPNFVSLDVEGMDLQILRDWDFDRFKPEIFCVETLTFTQNGTERKLTEIIEFMADQGYFSYADTYINTIFVLRDAWSKRRT